jgi:hypothetical protein
VALIILSCRPFVAAAGAVKVSEYLVQSVLGVAAKVSASLEVIELKLSTASAVNTSRPKAVVPVVLLAQSETVTVLLAKAELSADSIL